MTVQFFNNLFIQLYINLLNSDYINLLVLFIFTYFLLPTFNELKNYKKKILFFIIFYWLNCNANLLFFNFIKLLNNQTTINISLLNGFLGIHPILLYFSYALIIIFIFKKKILNWKLGYSLFILLTIVIILGSWWAEQELSWNSWWNWDLIELISYVLIIIILSILHFAKKLENKTTVWYYTNIVLFKFTLFLLVVRLNLVSSLHTFIPPFNVDQLLVYLFIYLIISFYFLIFKPKRNLTLYFLKSKNNHQTKFNFFKIIFLFLINFIFIIFFIQLLLNFFFNYNVTDLLKINLFLITYLSVIFISLSATSIAILLFFSLFFINFFVKYLFLVLFKFHSIHVYFILFLVSLLCYTNLEYVLGSNDVWIFFFKNISIKVNYSNINFIAFQNYFSHCSTNFLISDFNFFLKSLIYKTSGEQLFSNIISNSFFVYNGAQIYLYKYYFYINLLNYSLAFLVFFFVIILLKKFYFKKIFKFF